MKTILTVILLFAVGVAVMAQTTPPPPPGGGPPGFPFPGIVGLMVVAVVYGILKKNKNK